MYLYQDLLKLLDEQNQEGINDALLKKHTHINKEILDKFSINQDGKLLYDEMVIESPVVQDLSLYMLKEIFESNVNPGTVKQSDVALKIKDVEQTQPLSYYGKNAYGDIGFHFFPVINGDQKNVEFEQRVILDAKNGQEYAIDGKNDLSMGKAIIQVYKFIEGEKDIVSVIKEFNNGERSNFYYDNKSISFENGCFIKNAHDITVQQNDNLFESEQINKSEFIKTSLT